MLQNELNQAVARAAGEPVSDIDTPHSEPLEPLPDEPEPEDLIVDWDALQLGRNVAVYDSGRQQMAIA